MRSQSFQAPGISSEGWRITISRQHPPATPASDDVKVFVCGGYCGLQWCCFDTARRQRRLSYLGFVLAGFIALEGLAKALAALFQQEGLQEFLHDHVAALLDVLKDREFQAAWPMLLLLALFISRIARRVQFLPRMCVQMEFTETALGKNKLNFIDKSAERRDGRHLETNMPSEFGQERCGRWVERVKG